MSDIRPDNPLIRQDTGLAEYVVERVDRWMTRRDVIYRSKWEEYERIWRGEWAAQDRDRASERSRAIMPATQQAVDSAVSEVEEAIFGKERWFDVDTEDPGQQGDQNSPGRQIADRLLMDLRVMKPEISKCCLLGAVLGTGIGKIMVDELRSGRVIQTLVAIHPLEFVIDPGAETIAEAEGVAHVFHLPKNVILERQREGRYAQVDPGSAPDTSPQYLKDASSMDAETVRIIEWQGLVPAKWIPEASGEPKMAFEEDRLVEALVTIANDNVVLKAAENPFGRDRGYIAFQWDTIPGFFWGRGLPEKAYWPQKTLDSEIRARTDALAFSVAPMMAVNAAMVPRGGDFSVRPGRNIFFNGNPSEAAAPFQFPPPDAQTYQQSQEMQRQIEMATGQLQAATPFRENGRNETATGMSMMLGASIRRTRRTMANLERQFIQPLIRKVLKRYQEFSPERYPPIQVDFKVHGTLGMMARELEQMQLSQMLNAMPPGAPQLMILRAAVDNMSMMNRQEMLSLLDLLLAQSLQPQEAPRDLGGEARLLSAQVRQQEVQLNAEMSQAKLQMEQQKMALEQQDRQRSNQRGVMALAIEAQKAESDDLKKTTEGILNVAKAEAEELGKQLEQYRVAVESIRTSSNGQAQADPVDISGIREAIAALEERMNNPPERELESEDVAPVRIERDSNGLVVSVNGRQVQRNAQGLIEGLT